MRIRPVVNRPVLLWMLLTLAATLHAGAGVLPPELTVGSHVSVEGRVAGTGVIVATELEVESGGGEAAIEGPVQTVDAEGGTLVVYGITVRLSESTLLEAVDGGTWSVTAIQPGMRIETEGTLDDDGALRATAVEQKNSDRASATLIEIEGPVASVEADAFVVLGITVKVTSRTEIEVD